MEKQYLKASGSMYVKSKQLAVTVNIFSCGMKLTSQYNYKRQWIITNDCSTQTKII